MLRKIVKDNFFILEEDVEVYSKDSFWVPIPIKRKFGMTLLVQEEGVLMLECPNFKELIFKAFKIGGEKVEDLPPRLITEGNPFPFFNIFHLEQRK